MKKCITCGAVFTGTQPSKKFCSLACNRINAAKYQRESAIKRRERNRAEFEESQKKKGANYEPLEVGKYNRIAPKIIGDALYIGEQVRRRERALENIGWTLEAYDAAHAEQGGKCFICGKKSNKSLAADLLAKFAKGERSDRVIQTTSGVQKMVTLTKAGVIRLIQTSKKQGRHALTQLVSNDMVDCAV